MTCSRKSPPVECGVHLDPRSWQPTGTRERRCSYTTPNYPWNHSYKQMQTHGRLFEHQPARRDFLMSREWRHFYWAITIKIICLDIGEVCTDTFSSITATHNSPFSGTCVQDIQRHSFKVEQGESKMKKLVLNKVVLRNLDRSPLEHSALEARNSLDTGCTTSVIDPPVTIGCSYFC